MPSYRVSTIASLLGVSDDSVRRWLDEGHITADQTSEGPLRIDGVSVVEFINARPDLHLRSIGRVNQSIRNYLPGLVTGLTKDRVMSQVELLCGPFRVVSLVSTEAVEELGLEVGSVAAALIKATNVSVQSLEGDKL
ncbi:MAG: TOBE domain-containing protein [Actinomycetaceae bacterium]|nr:TOBE domain-containing protein [Actinomycetaceae bacterium]